ncbi:MAG TPA: alkyl sulfatase dimerization domain-containing protein [Pyrinomonadaceae bacterium]|nr:alkyl sulfatase dimerization domain-containing protein [Pyrinomonadaceae bacterium]
MDQNPPLHEQSQTADYACDTSNKLASPSTVAKNQLVSQELPFNTPSDHKDYADALNGYKCTFNGENRIPVCAPSPNPYNVRINKVGTQFPIWDLGHYSFLTPPVQEKPGPDTVNPSLWRQAKLNMHNGLFEVATGSLSQGVRGIYQVRAFDLSNMTIVECNSSLIVIDPLISAECASAALSLYRSHRNNNWPVKTVIYTHSHIDHYGGVNGVVDERDVAAGLVKIYAPSGFLDHAISENAFAGNAMGRRAGYMYGTFLPKNVFGHLDGGLGKGTSIGTTGLIAPTDEIQDTLTPPINRDGVNIVFMLAQDTEAPAEMLFHFPQFNALCAAEDMTHNLHNLYSIRGSQVRNAMAWWKVINEVIKLWGNTTNVIFAQHHWPMWRIPGQDNLRAYLKSQRDLYKYILDQSLRLLNHGRTMVELAEIIKLPVSLSEKWYNRGYYGTLNHDSKAVYQRYMGWYDANPSNLHPHPPVQGSRKYVEYMNGAANVLARAKIDFDAGDYRWVAEVLNHVVFADPESNEVHPTNPVLAEAKCLLANALEQMGYQAESGPWRNAYLTGAFELRNGTELVPKHAQLNPSVVHAMTLDQYFDYMGLRFNAPNAEAAQLPATTINWLVFSVSGGTTITSYYQMELMDYTLPYTSYKTPNELPPADIQVKLNRNELDNLATTLTPSEDFLKGVAEKRISVAPESATQQMADIFAMIDVFPANFNIVTPGQEQDLP